MWSVVVIVTDVLIHQPFQMPFIQNDHMIEQITTAASDPAFGDTVLPGAAEAGALGLDAEALYCVDHFAISTTVVDRRSAESIRAFDSGNTWRGIDVVFATWTNAADVQCRATRAIATR